MDNNKSICKNVNNILERNNFNFSYINCFFYRLDFFFIRSSRIPSFINFPVLWIKQTKNNFFITLVDRNGNTLLSLSGGYSKLKGHYRNSTYSAELVANIFSQRFSKLKSKFNINKIVLCFRTSLNPIVRSFLYNLSDEVIFSIFSFFWLIHLPHNGLRGKRYRRILKFFYFDRKVWCK